MARQAVIWGLFDIYLLPYLAISLYRYFVIKFMIYNPYLLGIILATLLSWASWVVVLLKLSPFTLPQMALSAFFASLFLALTGTFTLFIYYLHLWRSAQASKISDLNTALRQGFLISAMINIGLVFQRQRVLTWWDGMLLLFIVLLIEYYFMNRD